MDEIPTRLMTPDCKMDEIKNFDSDKEEDDIDDMVGMMIGTSQLPVVRTVVHGKLTSSAN